MKHSLLLHIGYHKTATTWMQDQLFTPAHGYCQIAGHEDVFENVIKPHGLLFDPKPMQDHIARALDALSGTEVPVISSELLCGHPFFGGRESDVYADRLHAIVPTAKILVSIRAQTRILPSVYMQYLRRGGTMPVSDFFRAENDMGYFGFAPEHFEYDRLVGKYQTLYGAENVHIITQESLRTDMDGATSALAEFCGNAAFDKVLPAARAPQSPSYPEHAIPVLRRINHIQKSTLNPTPILSLGHTPRGLYRLLGYALKKPPLSKILGGYRPASRYVRQNFTGHYSASNARLAEMSATALDLTEYD